jgi:hypothetical protein
MNKWYRNQVLRRTLFALGNIAFCLVIGSAVVLPARTFFIDGDARIEDERRVLARLTAIVTQKNHVQTIEHNTDIEMQRGEFFAGSNDNVINAELQTRLKALVTSAGAQSRAVQGLSPRTSEKITYSGARLEINGPLQSIYRAIFAIETATPYLFITNAVIRATPSNGSSTHQAEPIIQAQLEVFGAVQTRGRSP